VALVRWLERKDQKRPARIEQAPRDGEAVIASDISVGSMVLAGPDGDVTLIWNEARSKLGLPPGAYRVRTTRIEREAKGVHWFVSSTGQPGPPLQFEAGRTARLDVQPTVRFRASVKRKGRKLQLGFAITAADGRGLSVYRDGKRIPVTYRLLSSKGKVLAKGRMNYG